MSALLTLCAQAPSSPPRAAAIATQKRSPPPSIERNRDAQRRDNLANLAAGASQRQQRESRFAAVILVLVSFVYSRPVSSCPCADWQARDAAGLGAMRLVQQVAKGSVGTG